MKEKTKQAIYLKYDGHCAYCGCVLKINNMTVDHLVPKSKGGRSDINNLLPTCRACNQKKGNLDLDLFRLSIGWKNLTVSDLADFHKAVNSAKNIKFYFENAKHKKKKK